MIKDNVVYGPPLPIPTPTVSAGLILYQQLIKHVYNSNKAFVDEETGRYLTYKQFLQLSCDLAEALRKDGICKEDVMAICSENNIYFFVVVMAGLFVGLPITTINPIYTETELKHALDLTYPSRIFCTSSLYQKFTNFRSKRGHIKRIMVTDIDNDVPVGASMMDFIKEHGTLGTNMDTFIPTPLEDPNHIAFILFSSGTTGLPKGVMTTHKNTNARLMSLYNPRLWYHTNEPNSIGVLPFFHIYGLTMGLGDMFNGNTVYVFAKFEPMSYLKGIEKYRIPFIPAVPTLMVFLAQHPIVDKFDLSSVKDVLYASAVTSIVTIKAFKKSNPRVWYHTNKPNSLGVLPFFHTYGLQMGLGDLFDGKAVHVFVKFELISFLKGIEKYRIPFIPAVPTLMVLLAQHPIVDKFDLSNVKDVFYAGAATDTAIIEAFKKSNQQLWYRSSHADVLGVLPFFHAFGMQMILGHLFEGKTTHVMKQFDPLVYLSVIQKYRIDNISVVPALLTFLATHPIVAKFDLSSLKDVGYGSSPASPAILKTFTERFNVTPRQGYGLTEATLAVAVNPVGIEKKGSIGLLYPGISAYIRDPKTGRKLGPNQSGEICLKGDLITKGYYKNESATRETFTEDGYLRTGDVGYYDKEEYFYLVDRMKELIKYKSFQVAPAELESILVTHPKIKLAAVVGLPDDKVGELPMAFIVKEPNTDLTEKEVKSYLAGFLSKNKHLHGGVVFVDDIPLNSLGKISRKDVRKMLSQFKSKL